MVRRNPKGTLSKYEKRIVKALLDKGWRNQDIQALVDIGRDATISRVRVTGSSKLLSSVDWGQVLIFARPVRGARATRMGSLRREVDARG